MFAEIYFYKTLSIMLKLSEQEQIKIFDGFGAYLVAKMYIETGLEFCHQAQKEIFTLSPEIVEELVGLYLEKGHSLCCEAQEQIFTLPPKTRENLVIMLLEAEVEISDKLLPKILKLPLGNIILENYYLLPRNYFSREAQLFLLNTPQLSLLMQQFLQIHRRRPDNLCQELRACAQSHGWYISSSKHI